MALSPGSRLGPYEIVSPLGAGGMGEVYKARDTRLDRSVAIKVLPEQLAADPQFRERFDREARTISQLDHPHICALHDVGEEGGTAFLVMQYLEGETLETRLKKGALPLDQALQDAIELADALDKAHSAGIVHRDLKPANVMLTKDGVKLLDFGLAKLRRQAALVSGFSMAATASTPPVTGQGTILGTLQYMSPEQVEGAEADARSDIFALGVVLYEMLTGKPAFTGRTPASLVSSILKDQPPPISAAKPLAPAALDHVVRRCLAKDPEERWQSARDLRHSLELAGQVSRTPRPAERRSYWVAWAVGVASVAITLFLAFRPAAVPPAPEIVRLSLNPPENTLFTGPRVITVAVPQFALSPDGRSIVFVAAAVGARPTLWLRPLREEPARAMPGTDDADFPFWSPDSGWVGFFADGKLKKIPAGGGPALPIADAPDPRGGSWGPDETILFGTGTQGIFRVSASGGTVARVTELDPSRKEGSHRSPEFLSDGKHFLFTVRSGQTEQTGVYIGSLDGKTKKLVIRTGTNALYSPSGHLLFMDADRLMGQAFDAERLERRGQAFILEEHVGLSSVPSGAFSVSRGILAHARTLSEMGRLTWVDRGGNPSGPVGPLGDYLDFRLSPNQTRLAASLVDTKTGAPDIWLTDLALGNPTPFTFGGFFNAEPVWSPDGGRIVFRTFRSGAFAEFYSKSAGGGGKEEPVLVEQALRASGSTSPLIPWDWSPDGRNLLYSVIGSGSGLWLLPLTGDRKPVRLLSAPGDQLHGNFSPNGKLVAYSSNESGRFEVHVQTVPLSDRQWVVSTAGGYMPRWRADGRELYYLSLDWKLMTVPVGPGPSFGAPRQLFQTHVPRSANPWRTYYVPSRDGQRFLINTLATDLPPVSITVVLNWQAALGARENR